MQLIHNCEDMSSKDRYDNYRTFFNRTMIGNPSSAVFPESTRKDYPCGIENFVKDNSNSKQTRESGFADLPEVTQSDDMFYHSLALSVRVRKGELQVGQESSRACPFTDLNGNEKAIIASVMAMVSLSIDLRCDPGRHCWKGSHQAMFVNAEFHLFRHAKALFRESHPKLGAVIIRDRGPVGVPRVGEEIQAMH
jgi:hypothetical protein